MRRRDDFERRRAHLTELSDEALHARFWELLDEIVAPLLAEARTHTTPSIERSVLLRMGFSSIESKLIVERIAERGLLGRGAGRVVLDLARSRGSTAREAGLGIVSGKLVGELDAP